MTGRATRLGLPLLALVVGAGCRSERPTRVLRLAHGLDVKHPVHIAMVHMADRLAEISGGRMRIEIYPNGQLGQERDLIEMLQIGSLAMAKVSASPLESFVPQMAVFSVPYVFRNEEHLWHVLDGKIGRDLLLAGEPYYLHGLCYYDAGPRNFYTTTRPVRTPQDLRGLKIRVQQSITSTRMVRTLGGSATPIDWGELYSALQQGVVDGAENNLPSYYLARHYEVSRYLTLDEHTWVPDVLLISTRVWDQLSDQERRWLEEAAQSSVEAERRLWHEASQHALDEVRAAGVEIIQPDKAAFRRTVQPMFDSYRGTPMYDLLRAIERVP